MKNSEKFKDKIIYLIYDKEPEKLKPVKEKILKKTMKNI